MMNNKTMNNMEIMNKQYITTKKQYITPYVELTDIAADDRFMVDVVMSGTPAGGGEGLVKEHKTWVDEGFDDIQNPNTQSLWDEEW